MRTSAIKSISIIAGAALGAALVGLLGAYVVLPSVAPSVTADAGTEKQAMLTPDSTVNQPPRSDTSQSSTTDAQTSPDDDASADQDSSPSGTQEETQAPTEAASTESTASTAPASSAETASSEETTPSAETDPSTDTTPQDSAETAVAQALRDSLRTLRRRLRQTKEEANALRGEMKALRGKLAAAEAEQAKVNELSDALMDMRRRPLTNLLKEVNMSVLRKLYQQTTGQARTRLLQSMAPARAAKFVNQVVEGGASMSSGSPTVPDSSLASR